MARFRSSSEISPRRISLSVNFCPLSSNRFREYSFENIGSAPLDFYEACLRRRLRPHGRVLTRCPHRGHEVHPPPPCNAPLLGSPP
jgi:hypothetical protein